MNGNSIALFNNRSPEIPINTYGETKLLADQAIRLSQCKHTIVRFGGIFGKNGPKHLGINNAINDAISGKVPVVIGKGEALRNYIYVGDAAKLLMYCLENSIMGLHYAGSHESISIKQMLIDICDVYLDKVQPNYQDGGDSIDQITRVRLELPQTMSFKQALKAYV